MYVIYIPSDWAKYRSRLVRFGHPAYKVTPEYVLRQQQKMCIYISQIIICEMYLFNPLLWSHRVVQMYSIYRRIVQGLEESVQLEKKETYSPISQWRWNFVSIRTGAPPSRLINLKSYWTFSTPAELSLPTHASCLHKICGGEAKRATILYNVRSANESKLP